MYGMLYMHKDPMQLLYMQHNERGSGSGWSVASNGRTIVAVSLKGQDTETSSHFILTSNM